MQEELKMNISVCMNCAYDVTHASRNLDGKHSIETPNGLYEVSVSTSRPNCNGYCNNGGSIVVNMGYNGISTELVYLRNPASGGIIILFQKLLIP